MKDPELADAPEHPDAIAWEIRHCADRFEGLGEELGMGGPRTLLRMAALKARRAADDLERGL